MVLVPPLGTQQAKVEPANDDANQQPTLSHRLSIGADDDDDSDYMNVRFRALTPPFDAPHSGGPKKLAVVGSLPQLGDWHLDGSIPLRVVRTDGERRKKERCSNTQSNASLCFHFSMRRSRSLPLPFLF